ncbi:MAG: cytochrome c3 family protein [Planctomycetota bacterium]|nr:cytochrome c3 family protein [Planctomycetota bacterium]
MPRPIHAVRRLVAVAALALAATGGWLGCGDPAPAVVDDAPVISAATLAAIPHQGRPGDGFVGSAACRACHAEEHASWHRSYHRTMTQAASTQSVLAAFDGRVIERGTDGWKLEHEGGESYVRERGTAAPQVFGPRRRVVMTTGSHHMQVYWIESAFPSREPELLPFVYMLAEQRWLPREAAFVAPPDHGPMDSRWNDGCIRCHATGGQPGHDASRQAFNTRVAELGITCEACHGPGEAHAAFHARPEAERVGTPEPDVVNPLALPQIRQAQVCGQCHAASGPPSLASDVAWLVEGYPYRAGDDLWATRGISRHPAKASQPAARVPETNFPMPADQWSYFFWPDGQVRVSGREYNGLLESACYQRGAMTCLSCHSMHDSDPNDQLAQGRDGDGACLDCHEALGEDLQAHTHHAPTSSGSRCLNCHMPHTTWGLTKAIRSHEITSPSVAESRAPIRRPNACNLCHLDQTLGWTADHLARWYGHERPELGTLGEEVAASVVWLAKGDAGQRALLAWHMGWREAQAASGADWLAPHLSMAAAGDPYAQVRYGAARSLRALPGFSDWSFDFLAPQSDRTAAGKAAYGLWQALPAGPRGRPARLLFRPDGTLDLDFAMRLQKARDTRRIFLAE